MIKDLKKFSGYWFKESDSYKGHYEYMYISKDGNEVLSSVILSLTPPKVGYFDATLTVEDGKILVLNKKTGSVRQNFMNQTGDNIDWSVDGVKFRSWSKLDKEHSSQTPREIVEFAETR